MRQIVSRFFFILVVVVMGSVPALAADPANSKPQDPAETYRQLNLFGEVFERVRNDYVESVEDEKLIEAAINGMLVSLDPHSSYLNEKNFGEMQVQTKGEFGGLGIEVTMENNWVKVVTPIDDTPAYRAGLKTGDFVTHLDGEPVAGLTLSEAVEKMRGAPNTDIVLTIRRDDKEPFDVTVTRDIIKIQSVKWRPEGDVGYIRITSFNERTMEGVEKALTELKRDIPNLSGYVLDLRNNPGGLLDQAIAVSDAFLQQGEIVSTRGRKEEQIQRFLANPGDMADGLPMVVMINGGSASAAEIVSGALQDHHRAIVIGTDSFGKGSVQTILPLQGHGAMKLTTAHYYTPSGRSIQAKGIVPDILVPEAKVETLDLSDRRKEADLRGALANPNGDSKKDSAKDGKKDESAANDNEDVKEIDYQLARALDLLRGLSFFDVKADTKAAQ